MEEKYPTMNFCLLSSEKNSNPTHSYIATMEFLSTLNTEESAEPEAKLSGRSASVKSQFSPTSSKAELLTLCIYCKYMPCFLSMTVPEGIPIVCFGCCSCSSLPNCIRLA